MKRIRLGTSMLLIVIVALATALVVQHERASRRIAELEAITAPTWKLISEKRAAESRASRLTKRVAELEGGLGKRIVTRGLGRLTSLHSRRPAPRARRPRPGRLGQNDPVMRSFVQRRIERYSWPSYSARLTLSSDSPSNLDDRGKMAPPRNSRRGSGRRGRP